eukprot:scaffold12.g8142.t1
MVLPAEIFVIKALGWVQSVAFILTRRVHSSNCDLCFLGRKELTQQLRSHHVTDSSTGSELALAAYRIAMLAWSLGIGINQLFDKGGHVFRFFTVWNWWLLTLFFGLASAASLRGLWRARAARRGAARGAGRGATGAGRPADLLDKATMVAFAMEAPTTLVIDLLTWKVLVPMMADTPDAALRAHWNRIFFGFESLNQHGFNAAMMLGELALGRLPMSLAASGWLALWASVYGVWSTAYLAATGRYLYPFLNAQRPYAWLGYLGIYLLMLLAHIIILGLVRAREALLSDDGLRSLLPGRGAAAAAAPPPPPKTAVAPRGAGVGRARDGLLGAGRGAVSVRPKAA